jgi:hypothetical protein
VVGSVLDSMFGLFDIAVGGQITEFVMPFREKISWLSLGGIAVAFGPYFYMVLVRWRPSSSR